MDTALVLRAEHQAHSTEIRSYKTGLDKDRLTELLTNIFQLQLLPDHAFMFRPYAPEASSPDQPLPSASQIAKEFYVNQYIPMTIRRGVGGINSMPEELFLHDAALTAPSPAENRLFFLIGEVGCGKTTYVHHLLVSNAGTWFSSTHVWPVKIDLFTRHSEDAPSAIDFVDLLHTHLLEQLDHSADLLDLKDERTRFRAFLSPPFELFDKPTAIWNFVSAYRRLTGRHLFLVFDNLDFLFHRYDMETFFQKGQDEYRKMIRFCRRLVSSFLPGRSPLSHLGANILFVMRTDSYAALPIANEELPEANLLLTNRVFELAMPDWQAVLDSRLKLLDWALGQVHTPGLRQTLSDQTEVLRTEITGKSSRWKALLCHLQAIAAYGLRDLMIFLQHYSWLEDRTLVPARADHPLYRIMDHYPVGLIAFMLQGKRLYSQLHSRTPNLYVTNNQVDILLDSHPPHSYWLKRLLLLYIRHHNGRAVRPVDVLRTFIQDGSGYPDPLVRACLGSMSMASASCLIKVIRTPVRDGRVVVISNLELTSRGIHFLEKLCDRFFYLQLIVDDFLLPIPKAVEREFAFADPILDYSHLVATWEEYGVRSKELISAKALQARQFLIILDEALKCEGERYQRVFDALRSSGVPIPDTKGMLRDFDKELLKMADQYPFLMNVQSLRNSSEQRRHAIRADLEAAYSE